MHMLILATVVTRKWIVKYAHVNTSHVW